MVEALFLMYPMEVDNQQPFPPFFKKKEKAADSPPPIDTSEITPPPSPATEPEPSYISKLCVEIKESNLIKNQTYRLKSQKNVIIGNELVSWLVEKKKVTNKQEAVELGQKLIKYKHLHHISDEHNFKDEYLLYRFYINEKKMIAAMNYSAISNAADCTLKGILIKKGKAKWNDRFFVLQAEQKKLFYYNTPTDKVPKRIIDLFENKLDVSECGECKSGSYCFNIITKDRIHTQCAPKSAIQEEWINALVQCGCQFLEDDYSKVTAKNLFDFNVLDIDKREVSLNAYKDKVCLVVNVASF